MYKRAEFESLEVQLTISLLARGSSWYLALKMSRCTRLAYYIFGQDVKARYILLHFLYRYPAVLDSNFSLTNVVRSVHEVKLSPPSYNYLDRMDDPRLHPRKGTYFFDESVTQLYWLLVEVLRLYNHQNGYKEVKFSSLVSREDMMVTTQIPKFLHEQFDIHFGGMYLSPTGEVQLGNIDLQAAVTTRYCTFSTCFRKELNYGRKSRGLIRTLEFEKYELFCYSPSDRSKLDHRMMVLHVERLLQMIGVPYRLVQQSARDTAFSSSLTYDIEAMLPDETFLEISSISNCRDIQTRRRLRRIKGVYMHTINGSCLPIGRFLHVLLSLYEITAIKKSLEGLIAYLKGSGDLRI